VVYQRSVLVDTPITASFDSLGVIYRAEGGAQGARLVCFAHRRCAGQSGVVYQRSAVYSSMHQHCFVHQPRRDPPGQRRTDRRRTIARAPCPLP